MMAPALGVCQAMCDGVYSTTELNDRKGEVDREIIATKMQAVEPKADLAVEMVWDQTRGPTAHLRNGSLLRVGRECLGLFFRMEFSLIEIRDLEPLDWGLSTSLRGLLLTGNHE